MVVKFLFFVQKWLQLVKRLRRRIKKKYEVKFCFMQKEILYSFKERLNMLKSTFIDLTF